MLKGDIAVMKKDCFEDDKEEVKVILGKDEKSIIYQHLSGRNRKNGI